LLKRADARERERTLKLFTVSDAYRYFAGQALLLGSECRSLVEYLIPTNNILVFDLYFNLINKSNLIGRL